MPNLPNLTAGAVRSIMLGETVGQDNKPVLQVLGHKKISATGGTSADRFRLLLSDGIHTHSSAMLATQLNHLIANNQLEAFTVIRLEKYICNVIPPDRRVVIILEVATVASGKEVGARIGSPVAFKAAEHAAGPAPVPQAQQGKTSGLPPSAPAVSPPANKGFYGRKAVTGGDRLPSTPGGSTPKVFPISSLTPYQNRWTIKARVTSKSNVRTWSNSRGEGKLFTINLLDKSGEIKATVFKEQVDKLFDVFEVNKVYHITKGTLKPANKQYSTVDNDYEMTFNNDTQVEAAEEDRDLPNVTFNFVRINELGNIDANTTVDVIGVVKSADEISSVIGKQSQKEIKKRDLQICDQSGVLCRMTLWGGDAEQFDGTSNPIIAVKGARLSDWGGRSLSVSANSQTILNPDLPEAHTLRGWYDSVGASMNFDMFKSDGPGSGGGGPTNWKYLTEAKTGGEAISDKPIYFSTMATVLFMKKENVLYKACPSSDCNKKLIDNGDGSFRCEKCAKDCNDFKYRMILQVNLADFTDNMWVTCFQEVGESLLKVEASELGRLMEQDEVRFDDSFSEASFKTYTMRMRAKNETYNDEMRMKTVCLEAKPVDFKECNKRLIEDIEKLLGTN